MVERLTREQAAIIGAYTGITCGPFTDIQEYAEKLLKQPLGTIAFASSAWAATLRDAAFEDFVAICAEVDNE